MSYELDIGDVVAIRSIFGTPFEQDELLYIVEPDRYCQDWQCCVSYTPNGTPLFRDDGSSTLFSKSRFSKAYPKNEEYSITEGDYNSYEDDDVIEPFPKDSPSRPSRVKENTFELKLEGNNYYIFVENISEEKRNKILDIVLE